MLKVFLIVLIMSAHKNVNRSYEMEDWASCIESIKMGRFHAGGNSKETIAAFCITKEEKQ